MSRFNSFVVGVLAAIAVILSVDHYKAKPPVRVKLKVHDYLLYVSDQRVELKGEGIVNNGFCTTVVLNGRADTIVCQPHLITEANAAPASAEEDAPEPGPEPASNDRVAER